MWCDDPCRVNRWKGYRAVHRQSGGDISPIADSVHSSSDQGYPKHSSLLFLGLILVVSWSPQYEVNGRPRSWNMLNFCNGPTGCGRGYCPPGWLPQLPSKVAGSDQSFYHKFEALALIGLVAMVPMVITS